jgi:hypothetical protein
VVSLIFTKNQVIKISDTSGVSIQRILWIDREYTTAVTIKLIEENAWPEKSSINTLENLLENQLLEVVPDNFFEKIHFSDEELSEKMIAVRDNRWELIKDIVDEEPAIYFRDSRLTLIKEKYTLDTPTIKNIYKYLRLFWQRGNIRNALLPNYSNCGGRGKKRSLGEKKVGRPQKYLTENEGTNITQDISKMFAIGIMKYKPSDKLTLVDSYSLIMQEFFAKRIWIENGKKRIELEENRPTIQQFRYWYKTTRLQNSGKRKINRKEKRNQLMEFKPLLGGLKNVLGPGVKCHLTFMVSDIYLVAEEDPNLIMGRPTVYFVTDVFTGTVIGLYVGLEKASWKEAKMAIENTIKDKVEFCAEYGISIKEDQWPSKQLPHSILVDSGQFMGIGAEKIVQSFGIQIECAPFTYAGDLKGIVERNFGVLNRHLSQRSVRKEKLKVRERVYNQDTTLTLKEFTKIVILSVLKHNGKLVKHTT